MKSTGIIRRIDDLGRIVIPKEIRRKLCIREGDPLELYVGDNGVMFVKYNPTKSVEASLDALREVVKDENGLRCYTDLLRKISEMKELLAQEKSGGDAV